MRPILAVLAVLTAAPALAQTGMIEDVIDGDTFVIQGETVRLWGIDAPETGESCPGAERPYVALVPEAFLLGLAEYEYLVTCWVPPTNQVSDAYGRAIRRCAMLEDGRDIGAAMVAAGMVAACPEYAGDIYDDAADQAPDGEGIHDPACAHLTLCEW